MADINQFGSAQSAQCAQCEAMLADIFDKTLSPEEQAIFDRHLSTCADCSRMFIEAQRGANWLQMLHDSRPEPSADLLERILASTGPAADITSAAQANTLLGRPMLVPAAATVPASYAATSNVLPFRQRIANAFRIRSIGQTLMQPRLAMTAAMAFFSIALTLNLTGVRITQLKTSDFTPSSIKRSFYDANARVVRSIDNLRVVYELESRVRDLQRDSEPSNTPAPESAPAPAVNSPSGDQKPDDQKTPDQNPAQQNKQKQSSPRPRSGSSQRVDPRHSLQYTASLTQPGSSPESGLETRKSFVIFTPNYFNNVRQGGQA